VQLLRGEAFGLWLAVVNPLNSIGTAGAARGDGLPGAHVVTVLDVVDLTGGGREFDHEGAIDQPLGAVDLDRGALGQGGSGFQYGFGTELGVEGLAVFDVIFDGELGGLARAQVQIVLDEGNAVDIARSVEHLDALAQGADGDLDGGEGEGGRIGDADLLFEETGLGIELRCGGGQGQTIDHGDVDRAGECGCALVIGGSGGELISAGGDVGPEGGVKTGGDFQAG